VLMSHPPLVERVNILVALCILLGRDWEGLIVDRHWHRQGQGKRQSGRRVVAVHKAVEGKLELPCS
jgi:hypothetical protein